MKNFLRQQNVRRSDDFLDLEKLIYFFLFLKKSICDRLNLLLKIRSVSDTIKVLFLYTGNKKALEL